MLLHSALTSVPGWGIVRAGVAVNFGAAAMRVSHIDAATPEPVEPCGDDS